MNDAARFKDGIAFEEFMDLEAVASKVVCKELSEPVIEEQGLKLK